jgi:hypothetical protein
MFIRFVVQVAHHEEELWKRKRSTPFHFLSESGHPYPGDSPSVEIAVGVAIMVATGLLFHFLNTKIRFV